MEKRDYEIERSYVNYFKRIDVIFSKISGWTILLLKKLL